MSLRWRDRCAQGLRHLSSRFERWDWLIYLVVAGACILIVACLFYSSLRLQTLYARLWHDPASFDLIAQSGLWGDWSAPLDDVFIHFDFARSAARGYPFEWIEGNGYSSGGTSLLYPFVLAIGYWFGFQSLDLMVWAGIIACVSTLGLLMAAQRLFRGLPRFTAYLAPLFLLGIGVLDWTLFSGMEVALFLGFWGAALAAWDEARRSESAASLQRAGLALGIACLLLVATRPEAALTVAIFSLSASGTALSRFGRGPALKLLLFSATPGACLVVAQAIANRLLTGDFTAAGALAKLEMHHPYLTREEVWSAWAFHVSYQVRRITEHHLSVVPWLGWILWVFAALSLVFRRTRSQGLLLWASALGWIAVVALNGQVRWQNERYSMPALAWLLLAAALGAAALVTHDFARGRQKLAARLATVTGLLVFAYFQTPRFKDQVWFFGRASRNILDQHVRAGLLLREAVKPRPKRILLSDAGAIPYAADIPAIDLIGLGGYKRLPFARATRQGAAGGLELIERLNPNERPDVLALYPSWWHTLPLWFGKRLGESPVRGNVICGGASKVLYRADWSPMEDSGKPFALGAKERLVDALDLGDVINEHDHRLAMTPAARGHLTMKMLAHPRDATKDLWDGGRLLAPPLTLVFDMNGFVAGREATLLFRVAPEQAAKFEVEANGTRVGSVELTPRDAWQEIPLRIDGRLVESDLKLSLVARAGGFALYHVWATQNR